MFYHRYTSLYHVHRCMYDIWNVVLTYNLSRILFSFDSALSRTAQSQQKTYTLCKIATVLACGGYENVRVVHSRKLCEIFNVAFCESSKHEIKMCEKFRKKSNNLHLFLMREITFKLRELFLKRIFFLHFCEIRNKFVKI